MASESTKDSILSVANRLFGRFGFHKTSMDEIAKIARKAKGSLYYHFPSKEDLFKEVVSLEIENLKNQLFLIVNNNSLTASEKVKQYLFVRMEVLNKASNYHETLKADFYEHFYFIDNLRSELGTWEKNNLKLILLQGIDNNEFAYVNLNDMDALLDMFIMVLRGLEIPFFIQGNYDKYSMHFDSLTAILIKGISQ